jgi:hypothetical protein
VVAPAAVAAAESEDKRTRRNGRRPKPVPPAAH